MLTKEPSPEEYVEQHNTAMTAADFTTLVKLVDFRTLTEDIAQHILNAPPVSKVSTPKEKTVSELAQKIEQFFIKSMKNSGAKANPNAQKKTDLAAPFMPVPDDLAQQITGKFSLRGLSKQGAIVTTQFTHPELEESVPLHFLVTQTPEWKMIRLINISELLKEYNVHEKKLERARQKEYDLKRAKDKKRIEQQFKLDSCVAFVHQPSGQKTPLLTVRIKGYNNGPFTIRNMTFDTKVRVHSSGGELVYNHDINTAAQLRVGVTLEDSYTLDIDKDEKEVAVLLKAPKVTCTAHVQYMTLDNGQILFLAEETGTLKNPASKNAPQKTPTQPVEAKPEQTKPADNPPSSTPAAPQVQGAPNTAPAPAISKAHEGALH